MKAKNPWGDGKIPRWWKKYLRVKGYVDMHDCPISEAANVLGYAPATAQRWFRDVDENKYGLDSGGGDSVEGPPDTTPGEAPFEDVSISPEATAKILPFKGLAMANSATLMQSDDRETAATTARSIMQAMKVISTVQAELLIGVMSGREAVTVKALEGSISVTAARTMTMLTKALESLVRAHPGLLSMVGADAVDTGDSIEDISAGL